MLRICDNILFSNLAKGTAVEYCTITGVLKLACMPNLLAGEII